MSEQLDLALARATGLDYHPDVLAGIRGIGVHILTGPRRAGKTVATLQRVQALLEAREVEPEQVLRANLDGYYTDDLRLLLTDHGVATVLGLPIGTTRLWVLDEITAVSGWNGVVKIAVENSGPLSGDVILLTGSKAPDIAPHSLTVAGPRSWQRLLPMGFRDVCRVAGVELPTPISADSILSGTDVLMELHATIGETLRDVFDA